MSPMPTPEERQQFERAQASLVHASRRSEDARVLLFEARESLKRAQRMGRPLDERTETLKKRGTAAEDALGALVAGRQAFEKFTDPRAGVALLDDATPFLLFPLRLETRFGMAMRDGAPRPQLWVRVYPDDCLIDSFQPLPSATEIAPAQR